MTEEALRKPKLQLTQSGVMTTSLAVAEYFEKRHKNVLHAIQVLEEGLSADFNGLNFQPVDYLDAKGERRPMYRMTKDGFAMLAMGFTGAKALAWKERYIRAFNATHDEMLERRCAAVARPHEHPPERDCHQILRHLYRDTHSSERAALVMGYFLRIPNCDSHWHEASYRRIGEALKLVRPRTIIHRVHYLRERGHLRMRRGYTARTANQYQVDRVRIIEDATALTRIESESVIAYVDSVYSGQSLIASPGLLSRAIRRLSETIH